MQTNKGAIQAQKFYYTETFQSLILLGDDEIRRRLHDTPRIFRAKHLTPSIETKGDIAGEEAWKLLRDYLDAIEAHVAQRIKLHSPAFWLHLYRRIAPRLSLLHEGKRDDDTLSAVRQIAELAYLKHGNIAHICDVGSIDKARLDTFLDGHYYRVATKALGGKLRAQREWRELKKSHQSVMLRFVSDDLYYAFEVEGFSYEYWRTSAAMRRIGKGSSVRWNSKSDWISYNDEIPPVQLFEIHDLRIQQGAGLTTRFGTWVDPTETVDGNRIYAAQYTPYPNPEIFPPQEITNYSGHRFLCAFNFDLLNISFDAFSAQNSFMSKAFEVRHHVRLRVLLLSIWAISFLGQFPQRLSTAKSRDISAAFSMHLSNLRFRGYTLLRFTKQDVVQSVDGYIRSFHGDIDCTCAEIGDALDFVTLTETSQQTIGLWSGGKRPLLIPQGRDSYVLDMAGITQSLTGLFFGVREYTGAKGVIFEEGVRDAMRRAGITIAFSGEMVWADGTKREIDIAVRIGDRLLIIECFSFERPVDYELAKPGVFDKRKVRLIEKIEQARTLSESIRMEPRGQNFDFSWVRIVEWRLVSPFVEFAWNSFDDCFDDYGVPRILQVMELISYVQGGARIVGTEIAMRLQADNITSHTRS